MDGPRPARPDEYQEIESLMAISFGGTPPEPEAKRPRRRRRPSWQSGRPLVVEEDGKPVSFIGMWYDEVLILGCPTKMASIGGVCTHPDYRGRGHASRILDRCLEEANAKGARILVISGGRGLYLRAHCRPAVQLRQARIRGDSLATPPKGLRLREGGADDVPMLARLYQAESVRYVRSRDRFAELEAKWSWRRPRTWIVESRGEGVGYFWLGPLWDRPKEGTREVWEYAGARSALLDATPLLLEAAGLRELTFMFPVWDRDLVYALRSRGLRTKPKVIPWTYRLLNLPGLMRDLRPHLAARLAGPRLKKLSFGQGADSCWFELEGERTELGLAETIQLVLGSPEAPTIDGELGPALAAIFPLPFPMPGMNAV